MFVVFSIVLGRPLWYCTHLRKKKIDSSMEEPERKLRELGRLEKLRISDELAAVAGLGIWQEAFSQRGTRRKNLERTTPKQEQNQNKKRRENNKTRTSKSKENKLGWKKMRLLSLVLSMTLLVAAVCGDDVNSTTTLDLDSDVANNQVIDAAGRMLRNRDKKRLKGKSKDKRGSVGKCSTQLSIKACQKEKTCVWRGKKKSGTCVPVGGKQCTLAYTKKRCKEIGDCDWTGGARPKGVGYCQSKRTATLMNKAQAESKKCPITKVKKRFGFNQATTLPAATKACFYLPRKRCEAGRTESMCARISIVKLYRYFGSAMQFPQYENFEDLMLPDLGDKLSNRLCSWTGKKCIQNQKGSAKIDIDKNGKGFTLTQK